MNKPIQDASILVIILLAVFCLAMMWIMVKVRKKQKENAEIVYGQMDLNDISKIRFWGGVAILSLLFMVSVYEIGKRMYHQIFV